LQSPGRHSTCVKRLMQSSTQISSERPSAHRPQPQGYEKIGRNSPKPFGGHSQVMLSSASRLRPRVEYWYWFSCISMKVFMASSLATGKFPMSCGPFFRGFLCAGGVDSYLGEVDDDVEVLGSDFMGMRSSALGERLMVCGTCSSILTSSDGAGDGRTPSTETGRSHILTRSDSTYTLDGDVEG